MKHWNKRIYAFVNIGCILMSMTMASVGHADPDDPLEQLLRQRQKPVITENDSLGNLIRSKSAEHNTAPPPKPMIAPPPVVVARPAAPAPAPARAATESKPSSSPTTVLRLAASARRPQAMPAVARSEGRSDADALLSNAMGLIGVAYRFGGTSPKSGFDCSGFMQHIFRKAFAVNLPRTAAEQAKVGSFISRHNLQAGDMIFFRTSGRRISHVGMYVGNDRFIHAPRTGKRIEITSLSNKYWSARYAVARRVKRQGAGSFIR